MAKKKRVNKNILIYGGIGIVILAVVLVFVFRWSGGENGGEDNWIKDERGVWIKHGNPSTTPENVKAQQDAINCALNLYRVSKPVSGYNSECLGLCGQYAVDIVHTIRKSEDNLRQNQCLAYLTGQVTKFIELDQDGNIIKVSA